MDGAGAGVGAEGEAVESGVPFSVLVGLGVETRGREVGSWIKNHLSSLRYSPCSTNGVGASSKREDICLNQILHIGLLRH